jgi:hypothetical protein
MLLVTASCASPIIQTLTHHGLLGLFVMITLGSGVFIATAGAIRVARLKPTQYRILVARHYTLRLVAVLGFLLAILIGLLQLVAPIISEGCGLV